MEFSTYIAKNKNEKECLTSLQNYDIASCKNIIISGGVGCGKTHLIVALARKIIRETARRTKIITGVALLQEIRSTFQETSKRDALQVIKEYSEIPFLVIDDLGAEKATDWVKETLYLIIDNRYNAMIPTFITSNLTPKQLAGKLDARLLSRLMGDALFLKLDGHDHRLQEDKVA